MIIYDIGANNGDDIRYYLKKCDKVVAVEANPVLCEQIRERYSPEIENGRLIVENCAVTPIDSDTAVTFYVHKQSDHLSQCHQPSDDSRDFTPIVVPAKSIRQLIGLHGNPYYIKIDIEGSDYAVLVSLFKNKCFPRYISAESHFIEVAILLVTFGGYTRFKVVNGDSVCREYLGHSISTVRGIERHSFEFGAAGPFGEDVRGDWLSFSALLKKLKAEGLGWKDIHATRKASDSPRRFFWDALFSLAGDLKNRVMFSWTAPGWIVQ